MRKSKILWEMIASQKDEIKYLRAMVQSLNDRIIVMSGQAQMHELKEDNEPAEPISALNMLTGQIDEMPAVTEEQKRQKAQAKEELYEVFNH